VTFDSWTSKTLVAYLAVTAHWIDGEWDLRSELLAFLELEGSHSGENLAQELYSVLSEVGIQDKIQNLTSDNLTVNDKAIQILGQRLQSEQVDREFKAKERRSQYVI
jgi:hypothetical protein